jgi:hypothetical protein
MQSGLIQQYENSGPYNFYKELFRGQTVRQYYTKKGSAVDIRSQIAAQENYNNYRQGRKAKRRFNNGDISAFSDMIKYKVQFRKKQINVIRGLIDPHQNLVMNINDHSMSITKNNMDKFMEKTLRNLYYTDYVIKGGSADIQGEISRGVDYGSIELLERPKKKEYKNKNSGMFNYLNTTNIDLTRYQIIQDETQKEFIQEHCLIQTLLHCGISVDICNRIKLAYDTAYNFPKSKLHKIADLIKCNINLFHVRDRLNDNGTIYYNQVYGTYNTEIKIASFEKHYFILEDVKFSLFSIKNYEEVKDKQDFHLISSRNGKYYQKKKCSKINSLELIHNLFLNNHFKRDNLVKLIDPRNKQIFLNGIEFEQQEYEPKEKSNVVPVVFYADTETDVSNGNHKLLYMGIIDESDKNPLIITTDFKSKVYNYINTKINQLPKLNFEDGFYVPIVYFHNLKYDFNILKTYFDIKKIIDKDGGVYCVELLNLYQDKKKGSCKTIKFVDSYKMAPFPLSKFNTTFGLSAELNKKEAMAYTYYTDETKYTTEENIDTYTSHLNPKLLNTFLDNLDNPEFEYNETNNTFNPYAYYLYYLKYDVLVLRAGMQVLRTKMFDLTGLNINNILTISSLVDRSFKSKGCYDGVYSVKGNLRDYIGSAIYGGRVAVNEKFKLQELNGSINDYDAVSLYPSAMSRIAKEMGLPTGSCKNLTTTDYNQIKNYIYFIVTVKITKINKQQQIPFIGIREDGILKYKNDAGDGIEMTIDKITLEDYIEFHQIDFEIIEGVYWHTSTNKNIGPIVDALFSDRIKYKSIMKKFKADAEEYKSADIFQNLIKLKLNSSYGKTIIKKQDTVKLIKNNGDELNDYRYNNFNTIKVTKFLNDRQSIIEQYEHDDSSNFAHIGCLILSYSKRIMNEVMNTANDNNINIYYQDTDSMHLDNVDIPKLEQLYKLKYNREIRGEAMQQFHSDFSLKGSAKGVDVLATTSIFLGKKCYMDILESKNDQGEIIQGAHIRLKGITDAGVQQKIKFLMKSNEINYIDAVKLLFNKLIDGEKIPFILNPIGEKVLFRYNAQGVKTCQEFIRVLSYNDIEYKDIE